MSKFTFEKTKQQRRKSSEEDKAKIIADKEAQKAQLLEQIRKIEEETKAIIDDDEDIEIEEEEDLQEQEIQKHYDAIVSKTKNSKSKILLKFLEQKCKSIREVINIEDVIAQETIEVEKILASSKASKGSSSKGSSSKGSKTSRGMSVVQEPTQVESFKLDKEYYLIYGAVQSGKTQFLQGITIAHIALSRCPVIVILRNCRGDAQQLSNRFSDFIKEQNQYFKEAGFSGSNVLKYFYVGGNKSEESLRRAFTNCNMIVAIANKTQLNRLEKVITPETKYATIIDEADSVAYGEDDVQFRETLHRSILANSGRTYAITATTFNVIFSEKNIPTKNIIRLPINPEYRGLQKIQMKVIDPKNESELEDYLKLLSERNAYEHKVDDSLHRGLKKNDHPMIMLIKKFHRKLKQQELARQVVEIGNWSEVIVFNGDGLTMYSKHIESLAQIIRGGVIRETSEGVTGFKIKPRTVHIEENEGKYYVSVKAQIDEGLQYYKELHMSSKSTRISHLAIVSEGMADRGISFVSKDYKWHLTTQYYEPNKKVFADNIIQSIRLCGNYKDDLPSVLYSTEKVCDDLAKCFLVQEEMLMRCKASEKVKSIPRVLRKMQLSSEKVPEKRKFGVRDSILENLVEGEDGGVEMCEYNKVLEGISRLEVKSENFHTDSTDKLRKIVPESIGKSTILRKLYDMASTLILDKFGTGKWVPRTKIVKMLLATGESYAKDENQIYGHFRSLYQNKYSFNDVTENTNGFLMKKQGDLLWIKIN